MANVTYPYTADLETLTLYKHETTTISVAVTNAAGDAVNMVTLNPDGVEFHIKELPGELVNIVEKTLDAGVTLTSTGVDITIAVTDLASCTQKTYWADLAIEIGANVYYAAKPFPVHVREVVGFPLAGV
jgi:hypothetical protein